MTFDNIPAGVDAFIDANSLIYAATADPRYGAASKRLLERIENQEIHGVTSAHVVSEMAHRLMTIEAAATNQRPLSGMANWLRRHPSEVQKLSSYRLTIDDLAAIPIRILSVEGAHVSLAADLCRQFGLLMNDAMIVVVMRHHGLTHLASLDPDFDRVPGITRYAPM